MIIYKYLIKIWPLITTTHPYILRGDISYVGFVIGHNAFLYTSVHTPRYLPCVAVRLTHVTLKFELEYDNAPLIARQITRSMNWPLALLIHIQLRSPKYRSLYEYISIKCFAVRATDNYFRNLGALKCNLAKNHVIIKN